MNLFLIYIGKLIIYFSSKLNLGSGSTWPGHIALILNKNFIKDVVKNSYINIILIVGTNGKTTTGKAIQTILENNKFKVFHNRTGANLLNGIASTLIENSSLGGKINKDYAIFEIDENTLPLILKEIKSPNFLIALNLFRDQLDRYGEVEIVAEKWRKALEKLTSQTTLILNADDPQIVFLGKKTNARLKYFGVDLKRKNKNFQHASDSTYCPNCGKKLLYDSVYFSHLGIWKCQNCNLKHPEDTLANFPYYPLSGIYNKYNFNAAISLSKSLGIDDRNIKRALKKFAPAFGRQETIIMGTKKVRIFLSKNPTGFNESLRTILDLRAKNVLIALNDKIADGLDVSWIWDVDFENYINKFQNIFISGDRTYDMAIRLKYATKEKIKFKIDPNLENAIGKSISVIKENETLFVLPTYTAMLETRKVLIGKKIL